MEKSSELAKVYESVRKILPEGELYAVGGCVRDALLGKKPKDYDFCTSLTPEEMKPFIKEAGRRVYTIGEKFGTLGFKTPLDDSFCYVEVTTFRSEKYEPGTRQPQVRFGKSFRNDMKRRDFTINVLAYDGNEIIDLFAGELDLHKKLIKAVGEPKKMLFDDPLRILRAIRFSVQLGFEIEPNLFNHLKNMNEKLFDVAIERQVVELDKMFSIDAMQALDLLKEINYIKNFIPELLDEEKDLLKILHPIKFNRTDIDYVWKEILCGVGEEWKECDRLSPFEYYLTNNHSKRTKYLNQGICARFKFSNKRKEQICS